jgi:Uma2 family endonuclease
MAQQLFELPPTQEQRMRMSYDDFLMTFDENVQAEWIDGEAIIFMPPTTIHQRVVFFLARLLSLYTDLFRLGEVFTSPIQMRAQPDGPTREPDIAYIANQHRDRITRQRLAGPADLVVEVVSDESVARDRADKFFEYQDMGVCEYWIIDPRPGKERVDCYWLDADDRYQPTPPDEQGRYHARVLPGFWFRVTWLWQESPPDPLTALAEMRGVPPSTLQALRDALTSTEH